MVDAFTSWKDGQSTIGQRKKQVYDHGDFSCTWPATSSLQWELVQSTTTAFLSTLFDGSFTYCQSRLFKFLYKHDIL